MKDTDREQVERYLGFLRRLAPHTVWFGSVSADEGLEWEWMLESRGGGLPSATEVTSLQVSSRRVGRTQWAQPFIGATTERRHKGVRITVDVGSAHLRLLAQSPEMAPFGEWLRSFYEGLAARYAGQAPLWEPEEPTDNSELVKAIDEARARWRG
jgi:hypothetical protein